MLHLAGRVLPPFREGLGNHQGSVHLCAPMNTFESKERGWNLYGRSADSCDS